MPVAHNDEIVFGGVTKIIPAELIGKIQESHTLDFIAVSKRPGEAMSRKDILLWPAAHPRASAVLKQAFQWIVRQEWSVGDHDHMGSGCRNPFSHLPLSLDEDG
jgi:hypothetical protein